MIVQQRKVDFTSWWIHGVSSEVLPNLFGRFACTKEQHYCLHAGACENAAGQVEHGVQVAGFEQGGQDSAGILRLWEVGLGLGWAGGGLRSFRRDGGPRTLQDFLEAPANAGVMRPGWKLFGARLLVSGCFNVLCRVCGVKLMRSGGFG